MAFKIFLFAVLFLRIILFNIPSFQIDMNAWESWSYRLVTLGLSNFYSFDYFADYFPGYLYILWIFGSFYHFIFPQLSFSNIGFEFMVKFITTLFDIGTAYYIYKIVNKYLPKFSKFAALFYLVNPAVIFNSSVWGQIDGIFTFFLVYSCFLLTEVKKPIESSFVSSIAVLIKPHSLALLPAFVLYNFKFYEKYLVVVLLILLLVPIIMSIPFFPNNPVLGLVSLSRSSANVYPFTSLFAFNFWGILGWWKSDKSSLFSLSYQIWGFVLYAVSMIFILYPAVKNKIKSKHFYLVSFLSFMSFYLFLTRMHERYLFASLAFILIAAFINKSKLLGLIYFFISIVHFINLWYVYYYYNFVYNDIKTGNNFFYMAIDGNKTILSLAVIACFVTVLVYYYKSFNEKISK
ncbi:MAG TPA: hypothetical protein VKC89_00640 [Patescibacteria group bacterium]|nr:hypothetical protein [Patescibacteria group bacterium]